MLFQILFFEDFYLNRKVNRMIKESSKFSTLNSYYTDENLLTEALIRFEQETDSKALILSLDGKIRFVANYGKNTDDFQVLTSFCAELINDKHLVNQVLTSGKPQASIFENKLSNSKKIGILSPMSLNSKNDSIIVSVSSMQPINEAAGVTKEFYGYLFLGFSIIAVFLSSVYANLISKPLININKVAKRMSSMDFTAKCEATSDDEIGNLATTLNFLSSTLENALDDLKQKNKKLEEDIEKERKLEEMRKDFVASVSHDLKTPIGIIEGYAEGQVKMH
ncbi:HAMP domain-containing protein [Clostridium tertium]|uniref:HAMP domain-containing protein n=1 Tax=Clostridium tertium TaxID=1559 RepID=UPI00325AF368